MSGETNDALFSGLGDDEHRQELRKRGMNARPITRSTGKISGQNGVHEKSPRSVRGGLPPPQRVNKPMPEIDFSKGDDSSDEDAEESTRTLTPEEAASFRSNVQRTSGSFTSRYRNGEVATSTPVMRNVSVPKAKGGYNYSRMAKFVLLLFALAYGYYEFLNGMNYCYNWYHSRPQTPLFDWKAWHSWQQAFWSAIKSMNAEDKL